MKWCLEGLEGQMERFRLNRRDASQGRRQQCENHNRRKDGAEEQRAFGERCQVPSNRNFMLSSAETVVSIPMGKSQLWP